MNMNNKTLSFDTSWRSVCVLLNSNLPWIFWRSQSRKILAYLVSFYLVDSIQIVSFEEDDRTTSGFVNSIQHRIFRLHSTPDNFISCSFYSRYPCTPSKVVHLNCIEYSSGFSIYCPDTTKAFPMWSLVLGDTYLLH